MRAAGLRDLRQPGAACLQVVRALNPTPPGPRISAGPGHTARINPSRLRGAAALIRPNGQRSPRARIDSREQRRRGACLRG